MNVRHKPKLLDVSRQCDQWMKGVWVLTPVASGDPARAYGKLPREYE